MATIELKNICKRFTSGKKSNSEGIGHPFAMMMKVMKKMEMEMAINVSRGPFSMEKLNLTIPDGKTMVILGPSGCGKSTLLRIIAGLMQPEAGEILYDGVNVRNIPPGERQIGMVFQNYALYPHFSSRKNLLSYFLFKKRTPELDEMAQEKYRKTSELMGVDIEYLLDKNPRHLSGGEKQRVALGRCITRDPKLFLLDEPFSNLDQQLREKYRVQLRKLLRHFQITTVYVTHDQQEALILADLLAIMNIGTIEQVGSPEEIYNTPNNMFVAEFLNFDTETPAINFFEGGMISENLKDLVIGVRSEDIELCEKDTGEAIEGIVVDVRHIPIKKATVLNMNVEDNDLYVRIPLNEDILMRDKLRFRFKKYHIFDKNSGLRMQSSAEGNYSGS